MKHLTRHGTRLLHAMPVILIALGMSSILVIKAQERPEVILYPGSFALQIATK